MAQQTTSPNSATLLPPARRGLSLAMSVGGENGLHDIPRLREYGLGIEITDFIAPSTWQADYRAHARRWADALKGFPGGKGLHGAVFDLHPGALEPDLVAFARQRHRQSLEVAAAIGCDLLIVHSDFPPREATPRRHVDRMARLTEYFAELAAAAPYGITIVIENIYDTNPGQLADLARAIAAPSLGLSLDVGHAYLYGAAYSLDDWVLALQPALRHVHLHDNDGRYDRHWGVGEGVMSFHAFYEAVLAVVPAPRVTIEVGQRDGAWQTLEVLIDQGWYTPSCLGGTH